MLEFIRATVDDIDEYMKAKIDAFSDDVKNYGFGPSGYDDFEKEKEWYDGYVFDGVHIYNPKSVVDSIRRKRFASY